MALAIKYATSASGNQMRADCGQTTWLINRVSAKEGTQDSFPRGGVLYAGPGSSKLVNTARERIACVEGVKRGRGRWNLGARGRKERNRAPARTPLFSPFCPLRI